MDRKLLQRYVEGNVSKEEVESVVDWLDKDGENVKEFMALHKLYDISLFNKPHTENESTKGKTGKLFKKAAFELMKIAAVFIAFIVVSQLYSNKQEDKVDNTTEYQTIFIPAGQRAELTLPDSTKVWLNAKTKLVYPVRFGEGERMVTLDGEAYFDVRRNEKQPFIVKTKTMDIKVLGTEFNIRAYSELNTSEIALLKGAVDIKASDGNSPYHTLNVNENAVLNNGKLDISTINDFDHFMWKEGLLCFKCEPVELIIGKLELYFDIKIDVKKKELLKYKYTGKFRTTDGVEQVLKVLQLEHKFTYTRDNDLNLITIK